ncbi:hypothetical protein NLI96_g3052 [Meripilus lineatus]|uniref:Cytochrome P450 n=1 Tax=Meripilus lineatus TaxID=2056292 RepID=A0AAD5V7E9_9APHY|nr:hypothetical protein NLI96_g3052 [Physisporinus lineatus]
MRFNASTILEITYGHEVTQQDDEFVRLATQATVETAMAGSAGSVIVDFFPFLIHYPSWLPGSGFKTSALKTRALVRRTIEKPYQQVKERLAQGVAKPCITSQLVEESYRNGTFQEEDKIIEGVAGSLYGAGTETTNAILMTFILAMVRHPEAFRKAQDEIDAVVGHDRLPDLNDRDSLPYLNALITELYRYHPPLPLGIPHTVNKVDIYNGFTLPEGSMVMANIWSMSRNEDVYPEPEVFRPERFLDLTKTELDNIDPKDFTFGFGRRVCPGRWIAEDVVFLLTSRLISTMNIGKSKDVDGREITPVYGFTSGFSSHPKKFPYSITPRSAQVTHVVSRTMLET